MSEETEETFRRDYGRGILRSEMVSLFWAVIAERRKRPGGFALQRLADKLAINKGQVSRWFNGLPNWEANTVADIADALDVDIRLIAYDRLDGTVYTAAGAIRGVETSTPPVKTSAKDGSDTRATGQQKRDGLTLRRAAA